MKQYGKIVEGKDITNKAYVDEKDLDLDKRKLEETDFDELSNSRVLELWNQYIGAGGETGGGSSGTEGRSTAYVFDTLEDLETALANEDFVANLVLGDNFYIRATDVPDYWWDGTQKQKLETEKPDLTGFVNSNKVQAMIDSSLAAIGVAEEQRVLAETGREQAETERQAQEQKREEFFGTVEGEIAELKSNLDDKIDKPSTAPEVGKVLKVTAVNDDGTFVCEWADVPSGGGAVDDVMVNEVSVVSDGIANIPIGRVSCLGVIRPNAGLYVYGDGRMNVRAASRNDLNSRNETVNPSNNSFLLQNAVPIVPNNLDYAVKAAMCDGKGAEWTADEKAAARERMGLAGYELIVDVPTLETASNFHITLDSNGNALALKAVAIDFAGATDGGNCLIEINNDYLKFTASLSRGRFGSFVGIPLGNDYYCYCFTNNAPDRNQLNPNANQFMAGVKTGTIINDIWFRGTVPAGASIQIYGIRG